MSENVPPVRSRAPLLAAVGIVLVLDVAVPLVVAPVPLISQGAILYVAFPIAQVPLHAAWVIFGPGHPILRAIGVPAALLLGWWYLTPLGDSNRVDVALFIYVVQWCFVASALTVYRAVGFRLQQPSSSARTAGRGQYSIAQLFMLLNVSGVLAVLMGTMLARNWFDLAAWTIGGISAVLTLSPIPGFLTARDPGLGCLTSVLVLLAVLGVALPIVGLLALALFAGPLSTEVAMLMLIRSQEWYLLRTPPSVEHSGSGTEP